MDTLTFAGIGAAITAVWGWIRAMWTQFVSVFVHRVTVTEELHSIVRAYCGRTMYVFPRWDTLISSSTEFVRPLSSYRTVAFENTGGGGSTIMARGWRLIWFSGIAERSDGPRTMQNQTIAFLRGTFNIDTVIVEALASHYDATSKGTQGSRFRVIRHFADRRDRNTADDGKVVGYETQAHHYLRRYIGYSREDIGAPTSTEPFHHLRYAPDVVAFRDHVSVWYRAQEWYKVRNIPWRTSALFKGRPGNGKTSCARALAQEFDLPIHVIDVNGMSNEHFVRAYDNAASETPAVVLLEDFDRIRFDVVDTMNPRLTMDCVLNTVCGVGSSNGVLLIVTANDVTKLDTAMLRPGRLDKHIEFVNPSIDGKRDIAARILDGCDVDIETIVQAGADETGAEFEFRCQEVALAAFWSKPVPGTPPVVHGHKVIRNDYANTAAKILSTHHETASSKRT